METQKAYLYSRFSTADQESGNSLERQVEQSKLYALAHGLTIDESLTLQDKGISAFRGKNKSQGSLGLFISLVKAGKIEKNSVLLCENLDRISREQPGDALFQFLNIIYSDITIITVEDNTVYNKESININGEKLSKSLGEITRAHKESDRKSYMLKKAWISKRADSTKKLTGRCPAWLKPVYKQISDKKYIVTDFNTITERTKVINEIFDLKLSGMGSDLIAQTLNKTSQWIPEDHGWRKSYIKKILLNTAVIGEYQPCKITNGKRVPEGDPIKSYFPTVVSPEKFNRVQALLNASKTLSGVLGGRTGKISNLFSHLAKCGECGSPMAYLNKGQTWQYFQCDKARRKVNGGCNPKLLRYDSVEETILSYCYELNLTDILPGSDQTQKELSFLNTKIQNIEGESVDLEKKINNLISSVELTTDKNISDRLLKSASEHNRRIEVLSIEKDTIQASINVLNATASNSSKQIADIKELIAKMKTMEGEERVKLRINLRNQLRQMISEIRIFDTSLFTIIFKSGMYRHIQFNRSKTVISETDIEPRDLID